MRVVCFWRSRVQTPDPRIPTKFCEWLVGARAMSRTRVRQL